MRNAFLWRLFPWIFLVSGLVVSGEIWKERYEESSLDQGGLHAVGTVQWSSRHSKPCAASIRVGYVANEGQTITRYFSVCSNRYQPGDRVEVIYLPSHPEVAMLNSREAVHSPKSRFVVGATVGALFTVVGAALLVASRGRLKQTPETDA